MSEVPRYSALGKEEAHYSFMEVLADWVVKQMGDMLKGVFGSETTPLPKNLTVGRYRSS